MSRLGPGGLLAESASSWASSWKISIPSACVIAGAGILSERKIETPAASAAFLVGLFAMAALAEGAVLWGGARRILGLPSGRFAPWANAMRIFGELLLVELATLLVVFSILALPLAAMGGPAEMSEGLSFGLILFLVPALYIGVRWSLAKPALILEAAGPLASLGASWRAVENRVPVLLRTWFLAGYPLLFLPLVMSLDPSLGERTALKIAIRLFHGLLVTWLAIVGNAAYLAFRRGPELSGEAAS